MNTQTRPAAHVATSAALRNQDRIARMKADLQVARSAEQHAWRRRDRDAAIAWRDAAADLQSKINRATTAAL